MTGTGAPTVIQLGYVTGLTDPGLGGARLHLLSHAFQAEGRSVRLSGKHGLPRASGLAPATSVLTEAAGVRSKVRDPLAPGRRSLLTSARQAAPATTLLRLSAGEDLKFTARTRLRILGWLSGDVVRAAGTRDLSLPGAAKPNAAPAPDQLVFPGRDRFHVGEVLILGRTKYTPSGLIADVTRVAHERHTTRITYTQGGLLDAYRSLTLVAQVPSSAHRSHKRRTAHNLTPVNTTYGLPSLTGGTGNVTVAPHVTANVSYSFHPYVTLVITITTTFFGTVPDGVRIYYALDAKSQVAMSVTAGGSWSASHTFNLGHRILGAFDLGPVVVTPEVAASLTVSGSASAKATLNRSITEDAHIGMTIGGTATGGPYVTPDSNNGFHTVVDSNSPPTVNVSAAAKAKLALELSLDLYGVVGPDAQASAQVDASVNPLANPWWEIDASGGFNIGIDLNALNIGVLTKVLKLLHIPTNPSVGRTFGPYTLLHSQGPFTGTAGSPGVPGGGGATTGGTGSSSGFGSYGGSSGSSSGASVILNRGPLAPSGYRYAITLVGFHPDSTVTIRCYDSVSTGGFYTFPLITNASGYASISSNSCYSGSGPEHWVTANGIASNHVSWGASVSSPSPAPSSNRAVHIGWSSAHPSWISMTLTGFSPGGYQYSCDFGSGGDQSFSLTTTADPQTFDNGHTCYDTIQGDTVWVTVDGVRSNTITVPSSAPAPTPKSVQIGWSGAHPTWIWMTLNGFAPGSYSYSCDFASGGDQSFTLTTSTEPQTFDNGQTCYDGIPGDQVWVVVGGVRSNTITVP